jgi:hypothetical protein
MSGREVITQRIEKDNVKIIIRGNSGTVPLKFSSNEGLHSFLSFEFILVFAFKLSRFVLFLFGGGGDKRHITEELYQLYGSGNTMTIITNLTGICHPLKR